MTGSNTDPVSTPIHIQAASALLRLAAPFFYKMGPIDANVDQELTDFRIWRALRHASRLILERNGLILTPSEAADLCHALSFCPYSRDVVFLHELTFCTPAEAPNAAH